MITIGIDPVVFSVGGFELRWYAVMVVLAIIAVIWVASREARRVGIGDEVIYSVALWAVIAGIIVSRLVHVIDQWEYYIAHPGQIIAFEGLTIYGAILGALIAVIIYAWVKKISFWQLGDVIAPGAILGQAIGRIGCTINGCCYGLPTSLPWAVTYTHPNSYAVLGVPSHPAVVYLLIWDLIVFVILWQLRKRLKPVGSLFLLYLALYAAGDLGSRFFREGTPFLFGLQQAQVIGIAILVVTVPWLIIGMRRGRALTSSSKEADS